MKTITIKVKNCRKCLFADVSYGYEGGKRLVSAVVCTSPIKQTKVFFIDNYYKESKSPRLCPLKKQNLKIEFEK